VQCRGTSSEVALNTSAVSLDEQGNAQFSGHIANVPANCGNPLFLLRIARLAPGANGRWIATGTERLIDDQSTKHQCQSWHGRGSSGLAFPLLQTTAPVLRSQHARRTTNTACHYRN